MAWGGWRWIPRPPEAVGAWFERRGSAVLSAAASLGLAAVLLYAASRGWSAAQAIEGRLREVRAGCGKAREATERLKTEGKALSEDPFLIERMLREKYGWGRPDEIVIRWN